MYEIHFNSNFILALSLFEFFIFQFILVSNCSFHLVKMPFRAFYNVFLLQQQN